MDANIKNDKTTEESEVYDDLCKNTLSFYTSRYPGDAIYIYIYTKADKTMHDQEMGEEV